jgi:uncharacterized cupredoxin-like copper-binding protein
VTEMVITRAVLAPPGSGNGSSPLPEDPFPRARRPRFLLLLGALVGATLAGGAALTLAGGDGEALPTVVLTAHHSKFNPARIAVEPGTMVRFVIRNADPIAHELIIGPQAVHDRHEKGTESYHPPKPGEVTIAAYEEGETTYTFEAPGVVAFGCHLPGHWTYGMHGEVEVG